MVDGRLHRCSVEIIRDQGGVRLAADLLHMPDAFRLEGSVIFAVQKVLPSKTTSIHTAI